jgi:hypothetical protein
MQSAVLSVLEESYGAQRPVIEAGRAMQRSKRYNNAKNNNGAASFFFRIYSRKVTPEGHAVVKMTGTHKRSIFFSPSVQKRYKPEAFELFSRK